MIDGFLCWEPVQILLPREYQVTTSCFRFTSDQNLFIIFTVELQDTGKPKFNVENFTPLYVKKMIRFWDFAADPSTE